MNVKAVVKVMNFHALLRVDASRRRAEMYGAMENELASMMRIVLCNRNLRLDRRVRMPDPSLPVLRIYLGSDYGFCGGVNTAVSQALERDTGEKVAIGRKLRRPEGVSLYMPQEQLDSNFALVRGYLERAVRERCYSAVELVYNHFYNISSIKQVERRIYPLEARTTELENTLDDFVVEGDAGTILEDMIISYLTYEVKIAAASSYASENVMRQNATSESLKKLDEMEEEERRVERKEKNRIAFQKTIDSYIKQRSLKS